MLTSALTGEKKITAKMIINSTNDEEGWRRH
jgi:hypothetical protein